MADRLARRVIVVTGSSGIAASGARRFAAEGAAVFVIARDEAECATLTAEITGAGGRAAWAAADLRDDAATIAAVAAARRAFGRIDGLFAVAGGSGRRYGDGPLHEITLDGWNETMSLNGVPAFLAAREVIRAMLDLADNDREGSTAAGSAARGGGGRSRTAAARGGGSIVLVTSVLASHPVPDLFATHAYAAIKGAEDALARTMAAYYAPYGIRVNSLAPGLVATPMSARAQADPTTAAYVEGKQPLARGFLPAEAIADAALFLLSDEARYVTGQRIAVDGGWSVTEAGPAPPSPADG